MWHWFSVFMFKLENLINIDDESGVGRTICRCARFLVMLWTFCIIYVPKKNTTDPISKKIKDFCI